MFDSKAQLRSFRYGTIGRLLLVIAAVIILACTDHAQAAGGVVDPSFLASPLTGTDQYIVSLALQSDGKVIIGGNFFTVNGVTRNKIARLNTDGSLDAGFVADADPNGSVNAVVIQPDGKLVVGGTYQTLNGVADSTIVRLTRNGSVDATFNARTSIVTGGTNIVTAVVLQPDGKIIIGGHFERVNGVARPSIARLNVDGTLDTTFDPGAGPDHYVQALTLQSDGKLLVGGIFTTFTGVRHPGIVRLMPNGGVDPDFASTVAPTARVYAMVLQSDGKVIISGNANDSPHNIYRPLLARLTTTGALDETFQPILGTMYTALAVHVQADGKILVGGTSTSFDGVGRDNLRRLNSNGSVDTTFKVGTGPDRAVHTIAVQLDGKILIGGEFFAVDGISRRTVARLLPPVQRYFLPLVMSRRNP